MVFMQSRCASGIPQVCYVKDVTRSALPSLKMRAFETFLIAVMRYTRKLKILLFVQYFCVNVQVGRGPVS